MHKATTLGVIIREAREERTPETGSQASEEEPWHRRGRRKDNRTTEKAEGVRFSSSRETGVTQNQVTNSVGTGLLGLARVKGAIYENVFLGE